MKRPYKKPKGSLESAGPRAEHARLCLAMLQEAAKHARWAGLGFTIPRIDAAVSSARGAVANAEGRARRDVRPHRFVTDKADAARVPAGHEDLAHCARCGQAEDRPIHRAEGRARR